MGISESWNRIIEWHDRNTPEGEFTLNPGASSQALESFAQLIGEDLPDDFCESYSMHDGGNFWLAHFGELMSLDNIKGEWKKYKEWQSEGEYAIDGDPLWNPRDLDGPIKPIFWNPKRIFFTDNGGGDHLALDLDPPSDGSRGQVIYHSHEVGPKNCIAISWNEFLGKFADDLESGAYVYIESEEMVAPPGMYD